jgi:hypothetical protein
MISVDNVISSSLLKKLKDSDDCHILVNNRRFYSEANKNLLFSQKIDGIPEARRLWDQHYGLVQRAVNQISPKN